MFTNKDINTYLSTFLDDKTLTTLTKLDKEQNKNFNSDDIWKNKLKEVELSSEAFKFVDGYIKLEHYKGDNNELKFTLLEPFKKLQEELKENINKFNIPNYKSTYINISQFNKNLENKEDKEDFDSARKILLAIKEANDYEKFYYTKVFTPIIENDIIASKEHFFFCSTGMSERARENMKRRNIFKKLFNLILIESLNLPLDKNYGNLYLDLKPEIKILFESYKLKYDIKRMVEILMDNNNYALF